MNRVEQPSGMKGADILKMIIICLCPPLTPAHEFSPGGREEGPLHTLSTL